jgi:hypothetical protein
MTRLNFTEFRAINFTPYYPSIIVDLIESLCGFKMHDHFRIQGELAKIEHREKQLEIKMQLERLKDANFKENVFRER